MSLEGSGRVALLAAVAACVALLVSATAAADDSEREVHKAGTCTGSSEASIRLDADDREIEIEFEIKTRSATGPWRVVLLHERRVAFQGLVRPRGGGRSVRIRRTVPDWFGRDAIAVRAAGPAIETCRAAATV